MSEFKNKEWKLKKIVKITDDKHKYLHYYDTTQISPSGEEVHWSFVSRNVIEDVACNNGQVIPNCVCIIPRIIVDEEPALIITKEYRLPIGDYVYGFPAGIIDSKESPLEAAKRELEEEIGAKEIKNLTLLTDANLNSEGMSDESTITVVADVIKLGKQNLQDHEDIKFEIVKLSDINEYMKDKLWSVRAGMYIPMITKQYELIKENKRLEEENKNLHEELKRLKTNKR